MSVTPQTNTTLEAIAAKLLELDDFVICGHVSPDGDCLGSQLALMHALRARGKRATCALVKDEPVDERLTYLPGADEFVAAANYQGTCKTFVAVDVPTRDRMGQAASALLSASEFSITVDHHAMDSTMSDLVYVDPASASATMMIWEIAKLLDVSHSIDVATCCYTGLVTDTGRFQYQNTDAAAFRAGYEMVEVGVNPATISRMLFQNRTIPSVMLEGIAIERMYLGADGAYALSWLTQRDFERCGAVKADAEPIIDTLRALRGVKVACMLRDQGESVRGSFRAKDETDVAALARTFDGGGHKAAAGFTVWKSMEVAVDQVSALLDKTFANVAANKGVAEEGGEQ